MSIAQTLIGATIDDAYAHDDADWLETNWDDETQTVWFKDGSKIIFDLSDNTCTYVG